MSALVVGGMKTLRGSVVALHMCCVCLGVPLCARMRLLSHPTGRLAWQMATSRAEAGLLSGEREEWLTRGQQGQLRPGVPSPWQGCAGIPGGQERGSLGPPGGDKACECRGPTEPCCRLVQARGVW